MVGVISSGVSVSHPSCPAAHRSGTTPDRSRRPRKIGSSTAPESGSTGSTYHVDDGSFGPRGAVTRSPSPLLIARRTSRGASSVAYRRDGRKYTPSCLTTPRSARHSTIESYEAPCVRKNQLSPIRTAPPLVVPDAERTRW